MTVSDFVAAKWQQMLFDILLVFSATGIITIFGWFIYLENSTGKNYESELLFYGSWFTGLILQWFMLVVNPLAPTPSRLERDGQFIAIILWIVSCAGFWWLILSVNSHRGVAQVFPLVVWLGSQYLYQLSTGWRFGRGGNLKLIRHK